MAIAINFMVKIGIDQLTFIRRLWHSKMDWNIAMTIGALTAAIMLLHRVKIL